LFSLSPTQRVKIYQCYMRIVRHMVYHVLQVHSSAHLLALHISHISLISARKPCAGSHYPKIILPQPHTTRFNLQNTMAELQLGRLLLLTLLSSAAHYGFDTSNSKEEPSIPLHHSESSFTDLVLPIPQPDLSSNPQADRTTLDTLPLSAFPTSFPSIVNSPPPPELIKPMNPEFMEPQTNESGLIQPDITELELIQPMVIEVEFTQPESVHSEADPTLVDELSFIVLPASHSSAIPPPVSRREFFPTLLTHHAVIDTCPLIALPIPSVSSPSTTPLPAPQLRVLVMLLSLLMDVLVICLLTYAMLSYLQPVRVVYGIHDCYYGVMMYLRVPCVMPQSFVFHES
jgi:hypothetical protein